MSRAVSNLSALLRSMHPAALGKAGISCNVVAGAFHDHIFVPVTQAQKTLDVLRALQQDAQHA